MSVEIKVPALGESVSEATIAKWYKKPGDVVRVDELLLELETEKVTLEVNATAEGVLESIDVEEDVTVEVGQIVGKIKAGVAPAVAAPTPSAPAPSAPVAAPVVNSGKAVDPALTMPPSVQKLVTENSLNPANIPGTGKDGRINKGDVINALSSPGVVGAPAIEGGDKPVERVRMSRLRKTIAKRLKDSQNTAAILSTFNEIDMTNVIAMRKKHRDAFQEKHGIKLGFMSFFTKAVCSALKEIPSVNAEMEGDDVVIKNIMISV